jgi:hypothetical protein
MTELAALGHKSSKQYKILFLSSEIPIPTSEIPIIVSQFFVAQPLYPFRLLGNTNPQQNQID